MPIKYKIDVIAELKAAGYNTNTIRKQISMDAVSKICKLLNCQPGDIMEYVEEEE